ncbi:MAG: hypothetical protein ACR2PR_02425 [Pseudohongiellaceae bacterium]
MPQSSSADLSPGANNHINPGGLSTEKSDLQKQRDPELANIETALKRAARKAREKGWKAGVPVVYMVDGEIVKDDGRDDS